MSEDTNIEELKSEAASLGIKHNANIGKDKLKEKIDEHYKSQETSGASIEALVKANEKPSASKRASVDNAPKAANTFTPEQAKKIKYMARSRAARKTRVIRIVDNDQRQNNHTTTCTVNCSNEFFDLGTRILPLNEPIEVSQGHIDVLKEVEIVHHVMDTKTGLSAAKSRKRYSISSEDV